MVLALPRSATILLVLQIGPSALVGISLFLLLTPVQTRIMGMQFQVRKRSMRFTDGRSRLLQELLGSFAIVKYFTLERPFLERIGSIRSSELQGIRSILLIKAANQSIAMSLVSCAATTVPRLDLTLTCGACPATVAHPRGRRFFPLLRRSRERPVCRLSRIQPSRAR